ncbi:MAG: hypothetical protein JW953_21305, partial [Anaerolineae bacterium]|nr:hypothetical protein [Anaerolineae bacterium]
LCPVSWSEVRAIIFIKQQHKLPTYPAQINLGGKTRPDHNAVHADSLSPNADGGFGMCKKNNLRRKNAKAKMVINFKNWVNPGGHCCGNPTGELSQRQPAHRGH